jgi:hypothetical protein
VGLRGNQAGISRSGGRICQGFAILTFQKYDGELSAQKHGALHFLDFVDRLCVTKAEIAQDDGRPFCCSIAL